MYLHMNTGFFLKIQPQWSKRLEICIETLNHLWFMLQMLMQAYITAPGVLSHTQLALWIGSITTHAGSVLHLTFAEMWSIRFNESLHCGTDPLRKINSICVQRSCSLNYYTQDWFHSHGCVHKHSEWPCCLQYSLHSERPTEVNTSLQGMLSEPFKVLSTL